MAAAEELTPTSYITHHLTFFAKRVGEGSTLHVDTLVTAVILGVIGIGFFWLVAKFYFCFHLNACRARSYRCG